MRTSFHSTASSTTRGGLASRSLSIPSAVSTPTLSLAPRWMQAYAVALQLSPRSGAGSPLSLAGTPHLYGRPPPYVRALLAAFARGTLKGFPAAAPEMRAFSMQRDSRFEIETESSTLGLQCFAPPTPSISPPA